MSFELTAGNIELLTACQNGDFRSASKIVRNGAECNVEDYRNHNRTPLHYGCRYGSLEFVKLLVETYGCDLEMRDTKLETPLYVAYVNKHMKIVEFIIRQHNFNPNHTFNSNQQTLLHCACRDGNFHTVQYLFSKGGCNPEDGDRNEMTPLHHACQNGHLMVVQHLISEQRCNPEVRDRDRQTPLHYACQNGHLNIVQYLISERGCNVDIQNKWGYTSLQYTCQYNQREVIEFLVSKGKLNPNIANDDGDTALHIACKMWYDTTIVHCLLNEGRSNPNLKNENGQTPLELASDPEKIRELIRYGANPNNVYETFGKELGLKQPLQPPVKVFVVGNPSAGKSTLTAALKKEKSWLARTFSPSKKVSGVDEKTAGVIPHDFESKKCGCITLYDFAGQPEFYSSHAALLQNAIQTSPPIFLLVVDLREGDEDMRQTVLYWLSFLENQCISVISKSHVIIVGSHADILRARGEDPKQKSSIIDSVQKTHKFGSLNLIGFIGLDCQYSESTSMTELRKCLQKSCDMLRKPETINFNSHCFLVYLLDKFRDASAVTLKQLHDTIVKQGTNATIKDAMYFLPTNFSTLTSLCDELNDRGHILFLKDRSFIENSWVIIDKNALLSEITGTIFAPEDFKQHCKLASSTGIVPVSTLAETFPQHNLEMLVGFLSHLEFCHEITDHEVLQLASEQHQTTSENATCSPCDHCLEEDKSCYLLFPALIRLNVPNTGSCKCLELEVWKPCSEFCHFGWILKCSQPEQFFTSRFIQVLLLRLAFSFAFPHKETSAKIFPALLRKYSLWKNGIYWGNRDRIETLVEVVEQNKAVIVLLRSPELTSEYLQLRSSIIQKVLAAASEFCGKVDTMESLIDPSEIIKYPLKPTSQLTLFSLTEIAEAVVNAKPGILISTGQTFSLDKQVVFEPYAHLGNLILHQLFSGEHCTATVTDQFLAKIARCIPEKHHLVVKLFKQRLTHLAEVSSPEEIIVCVLQMWRDGCEGTYQNLREKLDTWSVFAGRNPLELAGVSSTHTLHPDQFADKVTPTHQGQVTLNDLGTIQTAIWDVRVKWYNLGLELGIPVSTLEVIQEDNHYKVDKCFTAMLEEWLKTNQTWSSLVEALKSPPVDNPQLAEEVLKNYANINSRLEQLLQV